MEPICSTTAVEEVGGADRAGAMTQFLPHLLFIQCVYPPHRNDSLAFYFPVSFNYAANIVFSAIHTAYQK